MSQTTQTIDLNKIEAKWQKKWSDDKIFEADVEKREKYFINFPFPYINGAPHLGHGYSLLKADAMARFQRMQNKNVLFPFAFHATGEPIVGIAKRVKKGDEKQIRSLTLSGVAKKDIPKFEDPHFVVKYFREIWLNTIKDLGMAIDWRRKFTTTTITPTFSKFVEWQYKTLKQKGYVIQGSHPVIWCPFDQNPTGDHDRLEGEGARVVDFIVLKFKSEKFNAFLLPATLRPETVYGVTNMFLHPDATYVKVKINNEDCIISEKTMIKFQDQQFDVGIPEEIPIKELIGSTCINPVTKSEVPILPGDFIDYEGSTGVVMSVPAHAPMDWISLLNIKDDTKLLKKWNLDREEVAKIEPISLISVEGYGEFPAQEEIENLKITSRKDPNVKEATKIIYRREHNSGVLKPITESYQGKTVQEVKDLLIEDFINEKIAFILKEPGDVVVCRCGTRNHVKYLENQWFLAFSDPKWKKKAHTLIDEADMFPPEARIAFHNTIDWLENKACARRSGLGTPLPWDKEWIVETLSDSVIYMAYYIVSKYVNDGRFKEEYATDEVYDYIFLNKGKSQIISEKYGIAEKLLKEIKAEFEYFYPFNLRSSGKDLVNNHLSFMIMHHTAFFPKKHWPKGIAVNGYVAIVKPGETKGSKMSKSKGNFKTIQDVIAAYGTDATRISFLTAGEGYKDAQMTVEEGEIFAKWVQNIYQLALDTDVDSDEQSTDKWLRSRVTKKIDQVLNHYASMETRSAFQVAYHDILHDIKWYLNRRGSKGPAYRYAIETMVLMLTPVCPHIVEEIWNEWGRDGFAAETDFPKENPEFIHEEVEQNEKYLNGFLDDLKGLKKFLKEKASKDPDLIEIYVSPEWKYNIYNHAREHGLKTLMKDIMPTIDKIHKKEGSKYIQQLVKGGVVPTIHWSYEKEFATLSSASKYLEKEVDCKIKIIPASDSKHPKALASTPMRPGINFIHN